MTSSAAQHAGRGHRRHRKHRMRKDGIIVRLKALWQALTGREPGRPRHDAHQDPRHIQATILHRRHEHQHRGRARQGGESHMVAISLSRRQLGVVAVALLALVWVGFRIIADTPGQNAAIDANALDELEMQCLTGAGSTRAAGNKVIADDNAKSRPDAHSRADAKASAGSAAGASPEPAACDDLGFVTDLARRALRVNPLEARALVLLGLIAEREGDPARADTLLRIAGARSWRDPVTQLWLFRHDAMRSDFMGALTHADALLRVDTDWELIFPALAAFTVDPHGLQALAAILGDSPWRAPFLAHVSGRLANDEWLLQLYRALRVGKTPPSVKELQPFLARLIKDGRFDEAYRTWQETLPPERRSSDRYPYNEDFAADPDGLPFDWVLRSVPGTDIQLVTSPDRRKGRALQIQFSGARVDFQNVTQLMRLPPGTYYLSGMVKAEDLRTQRGIWWRISCANMLKVEVSPALTTLGHTALVAGTFPWREFGVDFTVPEAGCPAQWLTLEHTARIGPERQIEGEIWFASLRIAVIAARESGAMCLAPNVGE